jgi:hypothetical protein
MLESFERLTSSRWRVLKDPPPAADPSCPPGAYCTMKFAVALVDIPLFVATAPA